MDALTRRLMAHPDNKTKQAMQHDCEQAAAELEALRKDAERYRWLRDRHDVLCRMYTAQGLGLDLSAVYVRSAEQLDGVIDAAMAPRPVLGAA